MVLDNGEYWIPEDFQDEIVADIFSGVPEIMVVIPEGNAKTTLLAGVNIYVADFKATANCLVAAASREQAEILFSQAAGLIYRSPGFDARFRVFEGYRRIVANRSHGRVQVKAADDRTGDGAIPDLATIDEPHRARDLSLWRTWRGKLDKRNGQILGISTAGVPGSDFEETRAAMHRMATESHTVGRHTRSASAEAIIHDWRLKPSDDPNDAELVKLANPLSTISEESLARKRRSPSMTPEHWARFVCNVPTSITPRWLEERSPWDDAARPSYVPNDGAEIYIGIDPAWHFDSCGVVALERTGDRRAFVWPLAIIGPGDDGRSVPVWKVRRAVLDAAERWRVVGVGYDRNRGFLQLAEELADDHSLDMVAVSMAGAVWAPLTMDLRSAINSGSVGHPADRTLTAHVLAGEEKDSPEGPRLHGRTRAKVDALMALGMAWWVAFGAGTTETDESPYEHKDLLILS